VSSDIDVSTLHRFFDDKVAGVRRASTAGADSPTFTTVGCELRLFTPVSSADVVELMKKLPDKQCTSDPLPTWLLKQSVEVLAPFLCRLFNWSFLTERHCSVDFQVRLHYAVKATFHYSSQLQTWFSTRFAARFSTSSCGFATCFRHAFDFFCRKPGREPAASISTCRDLCSRLVADAIRPRRQQQYALQATDKQKDITVA